MFDQLVFHAVEGERAGGIKTERAKVAGQNLHRRNTAGLDRLHELGPRGKRKILAAPQAEPLRIGEVMDGRGAGCRDIDDSGIRQGVLKAQAGSVPVDPARIGAFGFCFGGTTVLELARSGSDVAGVVSLHGDLETYLPTAGNRLNASVLVLNGADDAGVTDAQIVAFEKEMDAAGADWQFVDFSGAVHCFTQPESKGPGNCAYNERAAKRASVMMRNFFAERFAAE